MCRALPDAERNQVVDYLKEQVWPRRPGSEQDQRRAFWHRCDTLLGRPSGTLESADDVTGACGAPWQGATSPRTVTPSGIRKFYRLKL